MKVKQELHIEFAKAALTGLLAYSQINPVWGNYHENCTHEQAATCAWAYALAMVAAMPPEAKEAVDAGYTVTDESGLLSIVTGESVDGHDEIIVNGRLFEAVPDAEWEVDGEYILRVYRGQRIAYLRPDGGKYFWSVYGSDDSDYVDSIEAAKSAILSALSKGAPNA